LPHTRVNMGASIFFTAAMIRAFKSADFTWQWWDEYPVLTYSQRRVLCVFFRKCTLRSNHRLLLVWYSKTQNDFSPGAAISSLHTLSSPSGINVNYDEKQLTGKKCLSCSFYLYKIRKYGFPIINFFNAGVHYKHYYDVSIKYSNFVIFIFLQLNDNNMVNSRRVGKKF
jgi:hypothetical protein